MDSIQAKKIFEQGFNCCQAVLAAYAEDLGLDRQTAFKIASSFGGGMAGLGNVCGAVTGALMVIGLKYGRFRHDDGESKERNKELVRDFVDEFTKEHGAIDCRDLLGCDISTEEGLRQAREQEVFKKCPFFVESAALILDDVI